MSILYHVLFIEFQILYETGICELDLLHWADICFIKWTNKIYMCIFFISIWQIQPTI